MNKSVKQKRKHHLSIPERDEILAHLSETGKPRSVKQIAEAFGMNSEAQRGALKNRLKAMTRDGQLIRNRREGYGLIDKMDLIAGKIVGHADGYGFVIPDSDDGGDLYLSAKQMRSVMHGDRVAVRIRSIDQKGRREGAVVEILERANIQLVGRFFKDGEIGFVVPDNKRMNQDVLIPGKNLRKAEEGDFVLVKIIKQPDKHTQPIGEIVEVLGHHEQEGIGTDIAIRAFDLPYEWPSEVDEEIGKIDSKVLMSDGERIDLRKLPFVTIDGADARDFDDAVYCEKKGAGWKLFVAIADVSHYVTPDSPLDLEARNRGTSVYFPNRVVPMLPELLSNDLCSLKPEVDRHSMVCEMHISKGGNVKSYRFHRALIRSAARLTYDEMADVVVEKKSSGRQKRKAILTDLDNLYELFKILNTAREKRGLLDFDSTESVLLFDKKGRVRSIESFQRNDAHRLIEEFMLIANVSAADFLLKNEIPVLYRNHDLPKQEKLKDLKELLSTLGLTLGGGSDPATRDFARLIEVLNKRDDGHMLKTVLLRSLPLAVYDNKNLGHFGLAFESYAHFTSPIRRYPDLLVHRAIGHLIDHGGKAGYIYTDDIMRSLGVQCSMSERRAEEASRDVVQRMKCEYMHDKVGEYFSGTITSVTSFGLFIELDDVFVEGLLHVTSLPADYYHYDGITHELKGERKGKKYRLADRIDVQVMRVDIDDKKIDFDLAN